MRGPQTLTDPRTAHPRRLGRRSLRSPPWRTSTINAPPQRSLRGRQSRYVAMTRPRRSMPRSSPTGERERGTPGRRFVRPAILRIRVLRPPVVRIHTTTPRSASTSWALLSSMRTAPLAGSASAAPNPSSPAANPAIVGAHRTRRPYQRLRDMTCRSQISTAKSPGERPPRSDHCSLRLSPALPHVGAGVPLRANCRSDSGITRDACFSSAAGVSSASPRTIAYRRKRYSWRPGRRDAIRMDGTARPWLG